MFHILKNVHGTVLHTSVKSSHGSNYATYSTSGGMRGTQRPL